MPNDDDQRPAFRVGELSLNQGDNASLTAAMQRMANRIEEMEAQSARDRAKVSQLEEQHTRDDAENNELARQIVLLRSCNGSTTTNSSPSSNMALNLQQRSAPTTSATLDQAAGTSAAVPAVVAPAAAVPAVAVAAGTPALNHLVQVNQKYFELPMFDGKPERWPVFIRTYETSTLALGLDSLQNNNRLQRSLRGDALASVESLLINPDSVDEVISTLRFMYGRPELLQNSQIAKVRNFPDIRESRTESLVSYSTLVSNLVAFLNTNDSRHLLTETWLLAEIEQRLPQSKMYEWTQHSKNIQPRATLLDFQLWLKGVAESVLIMQSRLSTRQPPQPSIAPRQQNNQNRRSGGGSHDEYAVMTITHQRPSSRCAVCEGQHAVAHCDTFARAEWPERFSLAQRLSLCFCCLKPGHSKERCYYRSRCNIDRCEFFHHHLLHQINNDRQLRNNNQAQDDTQASRPEQPEHADGGGRSATHTDQAQDETQAVEPEQTEHADGGGRSVTHVNPFDKRVHLTRSGPSNSLLYKILPVTLTSGNRRIEMFAFIDEGSSMTLLDEEVAMQLQLEGPRQMMCLKWFGKRSSTVSTRIVRAKLNGATGRKFMLRNVHTVPDTDLPTQSLSCAKLDERLRELPISEYHMAQPKMIIGLDNAHLCAPLRTIIPKDAIDKPIAIKTKLGWVVYGPQSSESLSTEEYTLHLAEVEQWRRLEQIIDEYHTTDSFGVRRPEQPLISKSEARARHLLETTTTLQNDHYRTGLLWRSDTIELPDSFAMASQRLATIERKMRRELEYKEMYEKQICSYITKGYARKLTDDEVHQTNSKRAWYLPHFGVQNVNKPGKLRLVFDAAATANGVSLNSTLLTGPDLNKPLVTILSQFRLRKIGVCADIAEMFHQIEMLPSDRCSQRFLWREAGAAKPDIFEMRVMTFGATCSPTSAQFVKNTNAERFAAEFPQAAAAIVELHYVDDFVASFHDEEEAVRITSEVVHIHRQGGFNLRGFVSNNEHVRKSLGVDENKEREVNMQMDTGATDKILGLRWCTATDDFVFAMKFGKVDAEVVCGSRAPTKRELLSAAMSIFDPFGFLADFMLHIRVLIQRLWRVGITWDERVPDNINKRWRAWCDEIENIRRFRMPRCYAGDMFSTDDVQLHIFADASEEAFAAVAYWRIRTGEQSRVAFIIGKVKCAPIKTLTIPRLELQAAVLATRLFTSVHECHPGLRVNKTYMWTDSQTVLRWIRSAHRRYRQFVAHRIAEILESTSAGEWRWVPTKENVADDATRTYERPKYDASSRWVCGPQFLSRPEDCWPVDKSLPADDVDAEELPSKYVGIVSLNTVTIAFDRFSNLMRLFRATAWALRFVHNTRVKATGKTLATGELTASEINEASMLLCKIAQQEGYEDDYASLASLNKVSKNSSINALMPYMADGRVIRLLGRTDLADDKYLPVDARRPILLPKNHALSRLIAWHYHARNGHQLEDATICAIRMRFWIPQLRSLVRSVKTRCMFCKLRAAKPVAPVHGQLPVDRLTPYVHPFHFTGLDYFGPINVTVGRRHEKRWVALFTCLTTRAVHMELATDLSTDACLQCIRDFCNLRGIPAKIRSDCGTNFVGADKIIRKTADFIDQTEVQRQLSTHGITWQMNCPGNPEAGGAWERLVQSVKRVLAVTLKEKTPRIETLRSLVVEAANILNSRPLTHVPVDSLSQEPLTPNHFLLGRTNSTTTVATEENPDDDICTRKQWRIQQHLARRFWRQWVNDYLPELTRRSQHFKPTKELEIGSLVLICDANQTRAQWLRGIVDRVNCGVDGRIRTAVVRTNRGMLRRPVSKLAILDVKADGEPS